MTPGHQSLYRRYRSQTFAELIGQEHVVRALRNAVSNGTYGHAYLFSGPRGTGKTSTARILAKALNCPNVTDGEPDGTCPTCLAIADGTSFDVHELDAASNNGVDAIRDLVERASLGSPGRTKVYILDEVHMLSKAAEAALLKTLEEPPSHVVFVLATTDPQKVSATIRSRCQPFEFHLISTVDLERHVRYVIADAGLNISEEVIEAVVRQGAGSARDTLSALDQAAAAGGMTVDALPLDALIEALIARDPAAALVAVATATDAGRDIRTLADALIGQLRDGFLSLQAPSLVRLPDSAAARVADQAKRLGSSSLVRALEVIGQTLVELRHAPDPRVLFEVALVRLTNVDLDVTVAALLERIERLERGAGPVGHVAPAPSIGATSGTSTAPTATGPAQARAALGALKSTAQSTTSAAARSASRPAEPRPAPAPSPASTPGPAAAPVIAADPAPAPGPAPAAGGAIGLDMITAAWNDSVLPKLNGLTRAMFAPGRLLSVADNVVVYSLPNKVQRDKCDERRGEIEKALTAHFARPITMRLVVDGAAPAEAPAPVEHFDTTELEGATDAPADSADPIDRLAAAFPGAELLFDQGDPT